MGLNWVGWKGDAVHSYVRWRPSGDRATLMDLGCVYCGIQSYAVTPRSNQHHRFLEQHENHRSQLRLKFLRPSWCSGAPSCICNDHRNLGKEFADEVGLG